MLRPAKGIITLVLLVDKTAEHCNELLAVYGKVLSKHRYGNLRLFFLCRQSNGEWFERVLGCVTQLSQEEVEWRVKGCARGWVASAVLLFGPRLQLALFPENVQDVRKLCEVGGGGRPTSSSGRSFGQDGESGRSPNLEDGGRTEVGHVLGNTLGYESSDEDTPDSAEEHRTHKPDPSSTYQSHDPAELHPPHNIEEVEGDLALVEQVSESFVNWCERLSDGSLHRLRVKAWPEWTHP